MYDYISGVLCNIIRDACPTVVPDKTTIITPEERDDMLESLSWILQTRKHEGTLLELVCVEFPQTWEGVTDFLEDGTPVKGLPAMLLQPVLSNMGSRNSGQSINRLAFVRQLLNVFKKVSNVHNEQKETRSETFEKFCFQDSDLDRNPFFSPSIDSLGCHDDRLEWVESRLAGGTSTGCPQQGLAQHIVAAFAMVSDVFQNFDNTEVVGQHGPGAVVDGKGDKYLFPTWPSRLSSEFPVEAHAIPNYGFLQDLSRDERSRSSFHIPIVKDVVEPARFTTVPKTFQKDRGITIEPTALMFIQKGIDRWIRGKIAHSSLSAYLPLNDQTVNGAMALAASKCGSYATLDLESASDSLPLESVVHLLYGCPDLVRGLSASRSKYVRFGKSVHLLRKYAGMGNGTTFVVQSLIYLGLALAVRAFNDSLTGGYLKSKPSFGKATLRKYRKQIRVFGDDIIVPVGDVRLLTYVLAAFGPRVNQAKSYSGSLLFRESCGVDAYCGHDITPAYIRALPADNTLTEQVSRVQSSNALFAKGWWQAALAANVGCSLELPTVPVDCELLGEQSYSGFNADELKTRWNRRYQRSEIRSHVLVSTNTKTLTNGLARLSRYLNRPRYSRALDYLNPVPYDPSESVRAKPKVVSRWQPSDQYKSRRKVR
jgi:hypothetical protein